MRKLSFYPRLAASNIWRNKSTYLPYLLACVVSIATFFTLVNISFSPALQALPYAMYVMVFTVIGTFIVSLFCAVLLFYTNSFLIKRRKKEIALYSILGMEKGNIGMVMLWETLMIAVLSITAGILVGSLLSELMFMLLTRLMGYANITQIGVSTGAVKITFVFFAIVFLLTLLKNLRQVHTANPIELMSLGKTGEKEPKASIVLTVLGVVCVGIGYAMALRIKAPGQALFGFLLAALLVIIGTYCLFTSGSVALLKTLRKNKKYYYTPQHFISVSGLIYRMKQNAVGLASICILSCMVLVTVSSTVSMYTGIDNAVDTQLTHDYTLTYYDGNDDKAMLALDTAEKMAEQNAVGLQNIVNYHTYTFSARQDGTGFHTGTWQELGFESPGFSLVPAEEYGQLVENAMPVQPGHVVLYSKGEAYGQPNITIDDTTYAVQEVSTWDGVVSGQEVFAPEYMLVVPYFTQMMQLISARIGEDTARANTVVAFDIVGDASNIQSFVADYGNFLETQFDGHLKADVSFTYKAEWMQIYGGFLFLGIYFGVLFVMAAALIMYYKQLSEGYDDKERFVILQKVGMSQKEVKKSITKQVRTVFFVPLVVAIVHISVAAFLVSRVLVMFAIYSPSTLFVTTAIVVAAYIALYYLIYKRTARTYYNIVKWG